jgi:hypothetical protein
MENRSKIFKISLDFIRQFSFEIETYPIFHHTIQYNVKSIISALPLRNSQRNVRIDQL